MNRLFVQFYRQIPFNENVCLLGNGFSDTYDYCKNIGDFEWVDYDHVKDYTFPFNKGEVFVSTIYLGDLAQVYKWAKQYSNIKFIVGGPAVLSGRDLTFTDYKDVPNLKIVRSSVEGYFGFENFREKWNLDISLIKDKLKKYNLLYFTVSLNSTCYWKKCNFCRYFDGSERYRKDLDPTVFEHIKDEFDGLIGIRLSTPCITKYHIENIIPKLINDPRYAYDFSIRCDPEIYIPLKNKIDQFHENYPRISLKFGIEFPSNRMLKFIKKNYTTDGIIRFINTFINYENIRLQTSLILGWPNLIQSDVDELKEFVDKCPTLDTVTITRLFCAPNTEVHELFKDRMKKPIYAGPYYEGFKPVLTISEEKIQLKALNYMMKLSEQFFYGAEFDFF